MILIVCAMESEAREIKKTIKDIKIKPLTPNNNYFQGTIKNKKVLLVVTGIGKVNASLLTGLVLEKEKVSYILNAGYAGGVKPYKLGDVVIVKDASYHDVDVTTISEMYEVGQVPNMPHPFLTNLDLLKHAQSELKEAHIDSLYTGDRFMLEKAFDNTSIYDMEGAAIYQTAYIFNKDVISIKLISDIIDSETQKSDYERFEQRAENLLKDIVLAVI